MIDSIVKRDGSRAPWDPSKIEAAIGAAWRETRIQDPAFVNLSPVVDAVCRRAADLGTPTVEGVQNLVEEELARAGAVDVCRGYAAYRRERAKAREVSPDPSAIADYIHSAKYAKDRPGLGRRETREETLDRVFGMLRDRADGRGIDRLIDEAEEEARAGRALSAMRCMQFAGEAIERQNCRAYNCAFTHVDRMRVFGEIFYALLCGCGVGFSIQWRHVNRLPEVKSVDRRRVSHFRVPDSIEGWADAVNHLVRCYFVTGEYPEFAYDGIRPRGAPLTTGGLAPGHLPLKRALESVREILDRAPYRRLRPIECYDAICHLALAVLAGGIRRSSLIALFSPDDSEMLFAKAHGNFNPAGGSEPPVNDQRQMSNNSAVLLRGETRIETFERVVSTARQWGDPGFFWTDHLDFGCNPCGEIGMYPRLGPAEIPDDAAPLAEDRTLEFDWRAYQESPLDRENETQRSGTYAAGMYGAASGFQFCNLTETNVAACETVEQLVRAARAAATIGTVQASLDSFPYLGPVTEFIVRREALIGVGLTGIMDRPDLGLDPRALRAAGSAVVETNRLVARALGIEDAARCTTVKPSGTASLWLGCVGSGIHPHHAKRYLRRVVANPDEFPARILAEANPDMIERKPNGDVAIAFPVEAPAGATLLDDVDPVDFMNRVFDVYEHWVAPTGELRHRPLGRDSTARLTHNVSCTVVVGEDDWERVWRHAWDNQRRVAAMSFLGRFSDKAYPFAPREAVRSTADLARWRALVESWRAIDWSAVSGATARDAATPLASAACDGGRCDLG